MGGWENFFSKRKNEMITKEFSDGISATIVEEVEKFTVAIFLNNKFVCTSEEVNKPRLNGKPIDFAIKNALFAAHKELEGKKARLVGHIEVIEALALEKDTY
jgi:hypothetical protein